MSSKYAPSNAAMTGLLESRRPDRHSAGGRGRLRAGFAIPALAVAGIALLVLSCGDDAVGPTTPPTPPPPPAPVATTVTVNPGSVSFTALRETARFTAEVRDQNGQVMAGAAVAWASSDASVAAADASGEVTAAGNGTATITATSGSASGTAEVTVAQEVSAVVVSPAADTLVAFGDTVRLAAEATDANGHAVADSEFSWSSSDTLVARVDSAGLVTAAGSGTTTVTAAAGDASATVVVSVMQSAGSVVVSPAAATVAVGDTLRFTAQAFDENGHAVEGAAFSWSSGNPGVARVDATGLVTGVAEGTATVTATAGDASNTAEITVENPDRAALVALYEATDGPNWVDNTNWLTDAPLGEWYGVDTDPTGRITRLDLAGTYDGDRGRFVRHGLDGPIPPELGRLSNLEVLALNDNRLTGLIPPELGNLVHLERLKLRSNRLEGRIPREFGNLIELRELDLSVNDGIDGEIPPELSKLTKMEELHLGRNKLQGGIPPELGLLSDLTVLWLEANDLEGEIPPEIGNLTQLEGLGLSSNALTGPLPTSLLRLDRLTQIAFSDNDGLCAPGTQAFAEWLEEMEHTGRHGVFCNEYDISALESLYESASGRDWTHSVGWLGGPALDRWYGVVADSLGRVERLDLSGNGLAGRISVALAELDHMTSLRVGGNVLEGPLPLDLADVPLRELHYADTQLCVPADADFQAWLDAVPSHEGTGVECSALEDREILAALFEATDGPNWERNDNWLTGAPLGSWHGIEVDETGQAIALDLSFNNLTGPIPPEVGQLTALRSLDLSGNYLRGEIPPRFGNLANLRILRLWWSDLEGEIPPGLGNLSELSDLRLHQNALRGSIPLELGNLTRLRQLLLSHNNLSGGIPSELGNLTRLDRLWLESNELSGRIPPELGRLAVLRGLFLGENGLEGGIPPELRNLTELRWLWLESNELSGRIPPELGAMSELKEFRAGNNMLFGPLPSEFGDLVRLQVLSLYNNPGLSGPLPASLIPLSLTELAAGGTALCVPDEPLFREWLASVGKRRIPVCGIQAEAYLTQAAQSLEYPVPLVAGEGALLRVFVTSPSGTAETLPPVRTTFFLNGKEAHVVEIPATSVTIPTDVQEGELDGSANAEIPAEVIQPGLEMVVEIDPLGTLDPSLGVSRRIPAEGRAAVEVAAMPTLHLTLVPFVWTGDNDRRTADLVEELHPDHALFWETNHLLPVGAFRIAKHKPVATGSNSGFDLIGEVGIIRTLEGGTGHWMGLMYTDAGPGGIASVGGKVSFSRPYSTTVAHELGHNFSLSHAPCGSAPGPDPAFPYGNGRIGVWGYDPRNRGSLVPPNRRDLMGYCADPWISDYHFTNALGYRLADEGGSAATRVAVRSLLVSGQVEPDGNLALDPVFVVNAAPAMPDVPGPYMLTGRRADSGELFSIAFDMPEMADGDGRSGFVFAVPVQAGWYDDLASVTLSGPDGSVTLDETTDQPMAILRDPRTGQVRGFLRDLPPATQTADVSAQAVAQGMEVLFSRGIPSAVAWRLK